MPPIEPNLSSTQPKINEPINETSALKSRLKGHTIMIITLLIIFTPFLIYLTQRIIYKYSLYSTQYTVQKQMEADKIKQQTDYQNLLKRQAERNQPTMVANQEINRTALGEFNLHFILVKSNSLDESAITPLINKLKEQNSNLYTSLFYLNTFYAQQAEKYNVKNFNVKISFDGIYSLQTLEKAGDIAYIWNKDPFAIAKLQDSFNQLLADHNIKQNKNDLVIFLYFDDSFEKKDPLAKDRFYEYKKFRSFAEENTGMAYINVYRFDAIFSENVTEIAAHEILHLFGATDKYEESESVTRICSDRGRGNLDLKPAIPQQTADILCMYIEKENDHFVRAHLSERNLVINKITAKEIGWIN